MLMICANDLFYKKVLSNITSLMGSFLWKFTLNLHIQIWLLEENWSLLKQLLGQIIVNNQRSSSMDQLGVWLGIF
jgi:hypothetical protein